MKDMLIYLLPLIILQLGLQIFTIIKIWTASKTKYLNKYVWTLFAVCFSFLGCVSYFILEKKDY